MITITPHVGDSRRCSNCRQQEAPPVDVTIANVVVTLCQNCLAELQGWREAGTPMEEAVLAFAAFTGVRVEPVAVANGIVEARLYLPRHPPGSPCGAARAVADERHRSRGAIYALAAMIELAMRDLDFWSTTPYFHPVLEDYRGAVIIDCGISARATALAMVRGIADQLQGGGS